MNARVKDEESTEKKNEDKGSSNQEINDSEIFSNSIRIHFSNFKFTFIIMFLYFLLKGLTDNIVLSLILGYINDLLLGLPIRMIETLAFSTLQVVIYLFLLGIFNKDKNDGRKYGEDMSGKRPGLGMIIKDKKASFFFVCIFNFILNFIPSLKDFFNDFVYIPIMLVAFYLSFIFFLIYPVLMFSEKGGVLDPFRKSQSLINGKLIVIASLIMVFLMIPNMIIMIEQNLFNYLKFNSVQSPALLIMLIAIEASSQSLFSGLIPALMFVSYYFLMADKGLIRKNEMHSSLVNVFQMKSSISPMEKELSGDEPEVENLSRAIQRSRLDKEDYMIRTFNRCPECGNPIPLYKERCDNCGKKIQRCFNCGKIIEPGWSICPDCGQPLQEE
ncbi:MAG: zinc ribbon domain-containing protein [Promethearchaeota archaeon]